MQHTRVPQTVRRDWRLAIETLSIPSFHIFQSWIRNQIECWIEDRKKPNGPNRKSDRLTKKKNSTYLVPCWIFCLGWLMWCKVCTSFEPSYKNNVAVEIQFAVRYFRPNESVFAKFVPTSISPTLYGLLYSVVMFLQKRTKDTGNNNPIDQGVDMYISMLLLLLLLLLLLMLLLMP